MKRCNASIATVLCALLALATPASAQQQARSAPADAEVRALIAALGQSGCRFQRNGRWHDAEAARAHLQRKYDAARRQGWQGGAEDFIEAAASRSSVTGKPYRVECPDHAGQEAGDWFRRQLALTRQAATPR